MVSNTRISYSRDYKLVEREEHARKRSLSRADEGDRCASRVNLPSGQERGGDGNRPGEERKLSSTSERRSFGTQGVPRDWFARPRLSAQGTGRLPVQFRQLESDEAQPRSR